MSRTSTLLGHILRADWTEERIRLEDAIAEVVSSREGKSRLAGEDDGRRYARRVWRAMFREHGACNRDPLRPMFEALDEVRLEVRPGWLPQPEVGTSTRRKDARRRARGQALSWIDGLTDDDFEKVGAYLCDASGAPRVLKTRGVGDWGIDFVGIVPAYGHTHIFPSLPSQVRIVGQSKKWATRIPRAKIQEFVTTLTDVRHKRGEVAAALPNWFLASEGPIVGCVVSQRGFQSGARSVASDHGIILADEIDIAEVLVLDRRRAWDFTGVPPIDTWSDVLSDIPEETIQQQVVAP